MCIKNNSSILRFKSLLFIGLVWLLLLVACTAPAPVLPDNPFDPFRPDSIVGPLNDTASLRLSSFSGLHARIFLPTCANSGCHDGTFEPDFRTIESSYNTLVYHPLIKNDPDGNYTFRVLPDQPGQSVLWNRLTEDIDGQSGLMPLVVDAGNPWETEKDSLLEAVKAWIVAGAPDMFGNLPMRDNLAPYTIGMAGFQGGGQIELEREAGNSPIRIPANNKKLTLWFAIRDAGNDPTDLIFNKIRLSTFPNGLDTLSALSLQLVPPIKANSFSGELVDFFHRVDLDLSGYKAGTTLFVRLYVQEPGGTEITEMPIDGSSFYIKETFALQII